MSGLKSIVKPLVVQAVAKSAPVSWGWRRPGSLVVLMYHRVLPKDSPARSAEQPGMYVSPETLDLHLRELKHRFEFVQLDEWVRRAQGGLPLPRRACAITFDDGWRDNFDFALPVLRRHAAPATIFLVSSYIGTTQRFWPNRLIELARAAFADPGSVAFPQALEALVNPVLAQARERKALRIEDLDSLVQQAKGFDEDEIRQLIDAAAPRDRSSNEYSEILDEAQVADMAQSGLIRFGSHTMTHLRLGSAVSPEALEREIGGSRARLRELCGQEIELFCYPNGDTSSAAIECVRRHYLGAVTTRAGWHARGGDAMRIPRIGIHEDVSATRASFLTCLSGWL